MAKVDKILLAKVHMDSEMLPDWRYRRAWEEGYTPSEAAREAIKYARES
jgi:hypothetical protein